MIGEDLVGRIRDAARIERVVGELVSLERSGDLLRGASPFVPGDDRSLVVMPEHQRWRCCASGYTGDVFAWVQLVEGCSFVSAVERLGRSVGVPKP